MEQADLDTVDLLHLHDGNLLGARVWWHPTPDSTVGGTVVDWDDECVRVMEIRWRNRKADVDEHKILHSDIDPKLTQPATTEACWRLARHLCRVVADHPRQRLGLDSYHRRLIGFASRLAAA